MLFMLWSVLWSVLWTELLVGDSAWPRCHAATPMCPGGAARPCCLPCGSVSSSSTWSGSGSGVGKG